MSVLPSLKLPPAALHCPHVPKSAPPEIPFNPDEIFQETKVPESKQMEDTPEIRLSPPPNGSEESSSDEEATDGISKDVKNQGKEKEENERQTIEEQKNR